MARILPTLERMIKDGIVPVNRGGVENQRLITGSCGVIFYPVG